MPAMPPREIDPYSIDAISHRLTLTRLALDLKKASMARRMGVSPQAWNNWEEGHERISIEMSHKLCAALGLTFDWIYRADMSGLPHDLATKIHAIADEKKPSRKKA